MHPMPTPPLFIAGGRIIDPARNIDATGDVLLVDGGVARVSTAPGRIEVPDGARRVNAEGLIVCPGLLDIHVHLREPGPTHRETIGSGAASAVAGGFTTVCCMPNTTPALDNAAMVAFVQQRAAAARLARVFVIGCGTAARKGETLAEIASMVAAGAVGVSDDGDVIADPAIMRRVLQTARVCGVVFMQHCQDPQLSRGGVMNAGPLALRLGLGGWPAAAEVSIIERDIRLNRSIGCRYHAQHVSCAGSVDLIRAARAEGLPVSGEASPHHLLLTEDGCRDYDTAFKMNPPLRRDADVAALKAGVADGTITVLATDHAPHPVETKALDFAAASFGIVGLDCALPLYARALVHDGVLDWPGLITLMTVEPAKLVGLDRLGLGSLAEGGPGDVTLIDPDLEWTVDANAFASTGRNCPFDGWTVRGRAVGTIVGGRLVMERLGGRSAPSRVAAHDLPR